METATSGHSFVDAMDEMEPTLQNILDQRSLKWIFVGGKGGVGKTTCSCSLAVQLAAVRDRVLIISTDPAHNLSDAFRQTFNRNPTLVNGFTNLFAMEVDPAPAQEDLDSLEQAGGSFISDLAGSIPGIDEAMSFAEVMKQVQTMDYECIVFDTAPTGHTLRLLQFPATLEKGLAKVMSLKGSFQGMFSQVSTLMGLGEENSLDAIMGKLTQLQEVVQMVQQQFQDPELTTFVCVCIPEFLSLYETERLVQELARYEIDSRNIVINQVVFGDVGGSKLFSARVRMQQKYIQQFYDLYEDFHIVKLPLLEEEVRGSDALRAFSANLLSPYQPPQSPTSPGRDAAQDRHGSEALEDENAALKARIAALEQELATLKAAH